MFTEFPPWNFVTFIRNCSAIKIVMPGSFVYKLFTMILGQNYKSNKILLAEAFANCDKLQDADVAAKEKQLIQIKQLIKQMSASVKDVYGSFSAQL